METAVNPRLLLPDHLAEAVERLGLELEWRTRFFNDLDPKTRERQFRRDVDFCARLLSIYKTIAEIQRRDPNAHPFDPAQFLPAHVAEGLAETEKYLGELLKSWDVFDAHPTSAHFDAALKALSRIVALRRSTYDLAHACAPPPDFPGWDADTDRDPLNDDGPLIRPDGAPEEPSAQELIDRIVNGPEDTNAPDSADDSGAVSDDDAEPGPDATPGTPGAGSALPQPPVRSEENKQDRAEDSPDANFSSSDLSNLSHTSHVSHPSNPSLTSRLGSFVHKHARLDALPACRDVLTYIRSLRRLTAIPAGLLRRIKREGASLLYVRPWFRNPAVGQLASLAGLTVLYFPVPDAPCEKMSEAEIAYWRAEEQRRIRLVFRPEVEGERRDFVEPSLPPWGFDDPPWDR